MGPSTHGWADGRTSEHADWAVGGRRVAVGRIGWTSGRANERVGLGLKGHIP